MEAFGQKYVNEVRGVDEWVSPEDSGAITSETYPWLTLTTCKGYNAQENSYDWRVVVRAVQVSVD